MIVKSYSVIFSRLIFLVTTVRALRSLDIERVTARLPGTRAFSIGGNIFSNAQARKDLIIIGTGFLCGVAFAHSYKEEIITSIVSSELCTERVASFFDRLVEYQISRLEDDESLAILFALFIMKDSSSSLAQVKAYLDNFFEASHRDRIIESLVSSGLADLDYRERLILKEETMSYLSFIGNFTIGSEALLRSLGKRINPKLITAKGNSDLGIIIELVDTAEEAFRLHQQYLSLKGMDALNSAQLINYARIVDSLISYKLVNALSSAINCSHQLEDMITLLHNKLQSRDEFKDLSLVAIAKKISEDPTLASDETLITMMMMAQRLTYLSGRVFFYSKQLSSRFHDEYDLIKAQNRFEYALQIGKYIDAVAPQTADSKLSLLTLLCQTNGLYFLGLDHKDPEKVQRCIDGYIRISDMISALIATSDSKPPLLYDVTLDKMAEFAPYTLAESQMMASKLMTRLIEFKLINGTFDAKGADAKLVSDSAKFASDAIHNTISGELKPDSTKFNYRRSGLRILSLFNLISKLPHAKDQTIEELGENFTRGFADILKLIEPRFAYDRSKSALETTAGALLVIKEILCENNLAGTYSMSHLLEIYAVSKFRSTGTCSDEIKEALIESRRVLTECLKKKPTDADVIRIDALFKEFGIELPKPPAPPPEPEKPSPRRIPHTPLSY